MLFLQVVQLAEAPFCTFFNVTATLLAKDKFVSSPFTVWYNPRMIADTERKVTRIFRLAAEAGTVKSIMGQMKDIFDRESEERLGDLKRCFRTNIDLFMQEQNEPKVFDDYIIQPISVSMMDQVFYLLISGLSLPLIVLLLEKTHHNLDLEARERIKKQMFVAVRNAKNQKIEQFKSQYFK